MVVRSHALPLLAVAVTFTLGCSQAPPPQTPAVVQAPVTPAAPQPAPAPERRSAPPAAPRKVEPVIVELEAPAKPEERSLAKVAAEERTRRDKAGTSIAVIDDKNLADHAVGKLTYSDAVVEDTETSTGASEGKDTALDEAYWTARVENIRGEWNRAVEEILDLEGKVAGLRNRFYAEDDPYVRDGQIKPAWDHALESLGLARERAYEMEVELQRALSEGQRAGALPGWLRAGVDLEPKVRPYESPEQQRDATDEYVIGEPVIVDEDGG